MTNIYTCSELLNVCVSIGKRATKGHLRQKDLLVTWTEGLGTHTV